MNNNNNNNNNNMNNRCKKWSNDEDIRLYNQNKSNMTIQDIANNHQRSELAIKLRIELLAYNELLKSNKTFSEIVSEFKLSENDLLLIKLINYNCKYNTCNCKYNPKLKK